LRISCATEPTVDVAACHCLVLGMDTGSIHCLTSVLMARLSYEQG